MDKTLGPLEMATNLLHSTLISFFLFFPSRDGEEGVNFDLATRVGTNQHRAPAFGDPNLRPLLGLGDARATFRRLDSFILWRVL